MNSPKVTERLFVDVLEMARQIEHVASQILEPHDKGVYLLGGSVPVLLPGKVYFYIDPETGMKVPLEAMELKKIAFDIYDDQDNLVITKKKCVQLREGSTLPIQGMRVVAAMVEYVLDINSAWAGKEFVTFDELLNDFFLSEERYKANWASRNKTATHIPESSNYFNAVTYATISIQRIFEEMEKCIQAFIGNSIDDRWVMHFSEPVNGGLDVMVTKTCDYRIYQWERHNGYQDGVKIAK